MFSCFMLELKESLRFIAGWLSFKFVQSQRPSYVTNTLILVAFLIGLNRKSLVVFLLPAKNIR